MPSIKFKKSFTKDLDGLKRNARKQYQRVGEILLELQQDQTPSATLRSESRLPNCIKFELQDGYRVVFQRVEGEQTLIALAVGTHEHVDSFLDGHKGYIFDAKSGTLKELRLASADETAVEVVPSVNLSPDSSVSNVPTDANQNTVFTFTDSMYETLGVPPSFRQRLASVRDANAIECMQILEEMEPVASRASDLLLTFSTGNAATRESICAIARGEAQDRPVLKSEDLPALDVSSEDFITFDDPRELEALLDNGTFDDWQLFLHPDQRVLVQKEFSGPARIRGVSGSGKSVVALHRARHLAMLLSSSKQKVLFTTFDKGLSTAASRLFSKLCRREIDGVEITHLHRWCLDYLEFRGIPRPRYSPEDSRQVRKDVWNGMPEQFRHQLQDLSVEYIWSETEFIMGRFLHEDSDNYLETDRIGRGRPLTSQQRQAVLWLYKAVHKKLFERGLVEPAEFVRMAYHLRMKLEPTERDYGAVIVDEVQDISELALKLLHSLVGNRPNGLLLVGDTTQQIFTRGYSLRGIGIDISGRGVVLRKNYRNTRQILEASFPLVCGEWDADLAGSGIDPTAIRPEYSVREGHRPIIVRCNDEQAETNFISSEIASLLKYRYHNPKEICIVARNPYYRDLALASLRRAGIPAFSFKGTPVGEVTSEQDAVRVSTLHGAKGHEFGAIFIMGCVEGVIPQRTAEIASEKALLYVGMTRARDIVYLSYSERDQQGRRARRSELLSMIEVNCDLFDFHRGNG